MGRETRNGLDEVGFLRGPWIWLIARADNSDVTIVDRFVAVLCRAAAFLTPVIVVIAFFELVARYLFFRPSLWVNNLTLSHRRRLRDAGTAGTSASPRYVP